MATATQVIKKILPLFDRVLVEKIQPPKQTAGGILLPDSAVTKLNEGRVVAVGKGKRSADGKYTPISIGIGDTVMLSEYGGNEVKLNGKEYLLIREEEILGSASGKTMIAEAIIEVVGRYNVTFLHQDAYYRDFSELKPEEREAINYDHPDSLETELMVEHIKKLKSNVPASVPVYDFKRHVRLKETVLEHPRRVILIEGIHVLSSAEVRKLLDIKLYVDTPSDIRLARRLERDIGERGRTLKSVLEQYKASVRPMHLEFVGPSRRYADVIIPEGGMNRVMVDMLASHVLRCLRS
ncbi:uridine kinase-like [Schistocerca gregaria]|uniref:uridine kinase-like n=1 Tax=Schistocerca gregaria TaxID=7010 RepID=UPI00211E9411|nr:uridine kinase-like [Schistocerca gregaria]